MKRRKREREEKVELKHKNSNLKNINKVDFENGEERIFGEKPTNSAVEKEKGKNGKKCEESESDVYLII